MSKHIADHGKSRSDESRLKHYTDIERQGGDGASAREKAMHRQSKPSNNEERLKRFLDQDRAQD